MVRKSKIHRRSGGTRLLLAIPIALAFIGSLSACNVTRRTVVESSYYQRGDTTCTITTKTVETYDAKKNLTY